MKMSRSLLYTTLRLIKPVLFTTKTINPMISKVITHDSIFHADDVMSVALLLEFIRPTLPVERTRNIAADEFTNPDIWIVDVGGLYNKELNNFDHHQDSNLHSACVLLFKHLYNKSYIDGDIYDELIDTLLEISDIDCNGPQDKNGFQFNTLIKSFNNLEDGFDKAVWVCRNYIQSCKENVERATLSREIWDSGERKGDDIVVCNAFPSHWKRYEEEMFLVYPQAGKWNLLTRDSVNHHLVSIGKENFIHSNKFLAVFDNKEDAIACARVSSIISRV